MIVCKLPMIVCKLLNEQDAEIQTLRAAAKQFAAEMLRGEKRAARLRKLLGPIEGTNFSPEAALRKHAESWPELPSGPAAFDRADEISEALKESE